MMLNNLKAACIAVKAIGKGSKDKLVFLNLSYYIKVEQWELAILNQKFKDIIII